MRSKTAEEQGMSENEKILVVVEPDNHPKEVVERASWLAELNNCDLHLVLCDPEFGALSAGIFLSNETRDLAQQIRAVQKEMIDQFASDARDRGINVSTDVLEERPVSDAIMHIALDMQPRYIVKGTEYHSVAERAIFVDTDWQLIRTCPFPLWLVKPHEIGERPVVVAAVDPVHSHDKPAALDQLIVETAKKITAPVDGEVHLLHTYQRIAGIGKEATKTFKPIKLPIDELSKKIQAEHREQLDQLAAATGIDAEHTHQLPGSTKDLLPTFARAHGADVVVMGALARWGLKRMVIGSTAEKVLDHLPCDILIVRLPDKESAQAVAM
jgi:universal stress protein E